MSTTIKVEVCTKEPRIWQGKTTWGVKTPDKGWVTLYREQKPERGEEIEVNISERKGKGGMVYVDAFPVQPPLAVRAGLEKPKENGAKQITWDDYRNLAEAAHELASKLEPDEIKTYPFGEDGNDKESHLLKVDRSTARAAILNTVMIAYSNGKFTVPKEEDSYVPPPEDDLPPF